MKKINKFFLIVIISIIMTVVIPYIKVEILTIQHGKEFSMLYKSNKMLNEIEYFKIMDYSKKTAKVYYVGKDKKVGLMYLFIKDKSGEWNLKSWKAVWSTSGSADDFTWPYYR